MCSFCLNNKKTIIIFSSHFWFNSQAETGNPTKYFCIYIIIIYWGSLFWHSQKTCLVWLCNQARIFSWIQPVLSNEVKVSYSNNGSLWAGSNSWLTSEHTNHTMLYVIYWITMQQWKPITLLRSILHTQGVDENESKFNRQVCQY